MFEQATLSPAPVSTRLWSTCAGVTGQALIVGCMLLAPLIWPQVLPQLQSYVTLTAPGPPPPPPPPPSGNMTVVPRHIATRVCSVCMPVRIPDHVTMLSEDPPEISSGSGVSGGVIGGIPNGGGDVLMTGILRDLPVAAPRPVEPPKQPVVAAAPPKIPRYVVGGNVKLASPIRRVDPVYPQLARIGRIEGVVQLQGVIGTDGRIHELKVLSGHPFLVKAAVEAVQQWLYNPGTLNGELVEVIAPITVTFRLGGR